MDNLINQIMQFCIQDTQEIIAELEEKRFENQGAFNGHERWADNAQDVMADKGFNRPLYDTGELKKQLTTANNWDVSPKISKSSLKLSIPTRESFTSQKYDKLDTGGAAEAYTSIRGNKMSARNIPARPFKDISDQDVNWVVNKLVQDIESKFA